MSDVVPAKAGAPVDGSAHYAEVPTLAGTTLSHPAKSR